MLLHSLRALWKAPGGGGSIWKCLKAVVRATGVSGRSACGVWTDLHCADASGAFRGGGGEGEAKPTSPHYSGQPSPLVSG
jgi:hypothetical protein